ncbi:MAG: caspase family protein [Chitinophagaceae bacterium]|nr:caspase family protein [Chitinophagaceae bacterium]MBK7680542.1 caspase family protein [Chitinophagaceae bacterium]MBK9465160.1 caspase family protein [Chitinophagaceae bacterium]
MKRSSLKYVLVCLLSLLIVKINAQPRPGDATLQINGQGHLSQISESIQTADGKFIITSSTDKTICIWDVANKKLLEQVRGGKSIFNQGKIYAIAISPDNRFLAVGGFLAIGTETDGELAGQIRIYDFATRKQILRLQGHANVVTALRFSADGKFLLSGASDSSVIAWKIVSTGAKPLFTISKKILQSGLLLEDIETFGNTVLVTEENHLVKYILPSMFRKTVSWNYQGEVSSISVNQNKNIVVITTTRDELVVMDTALREIQHVKLDDYSSHAALSPNGQYLITEGKDSKVTFFVKKSGKYIKSSNIDFPGGSTVLGMGFTANNEFYMAGGPLNLLQFYSVSGDGSTAAVTPGVKLTSTGKTFTGISVNGNNLALNDDALNYTTSPTDFKYLFNTEAGRLLPFDLADTSLYPISKTEKDSLRLLYSNAAADMLIYTNDSVTGTVNRDGGNGYRHICGIITKKGQVISGSGAGFLNMYDNRGRMLAAFIGHEGDVKSISETKDGNYLFSVSFDKTIRMWDLRQVKNQISYKNYDELEDVWKEFIKNNYPDLDVLKENSMETLYNIMMSDNGNGASINAPYLIKPQVVEPRLNIFIAENNEWVMWNGNGYFKASANGAAYIGWYIYKGEDENAEFYTADKLYDNYYRPDIINRLLLSNEYAADILKDSKSDSKLSIAQQVSNMPVLKLERPTVTGPVIEKNISLVFSIDNKDNLEDVILFQNGKRISIPQEKIRGLKVNTLSIPVELVSGENLFVASVLNKSKVESSPVKFNLTWAGAQPTSSLYILTVGVDKYRNSKYNLNYARADASGVALQLAASAATIFKNIQVDSLFDENATAENLRTKLELLQKRIKPEDVFLFFYAGHGIMNDPEDGSKPDFHLVLHKVTQMEGNETMLRENAMSATGLKDLLLKISAQKQLILIDACNSGGAITTFTRGVGEEAAIFQLARSTGFTVLSSTNQDQFATEVKAIGHGIFTYALLNGLNGEADLKNDGKITVKEIELYLNDIIPLLSEKYKGSQQFPQSFSRGMDFPLTIKAK